MKLKTNAYYRPQLNTWEFELEDDCYEFFIFSSKEEEIEMKIYKKNHGYLKEKDELEKKVKESVLFNEIMEKIKNWEQKMKDMLTIDQVEIIGKEEESGTDYYFFSFEIQSKLPLWTFGIGGKEEKILENFEECNEDSDQDSRFVFILPLAKAIVKNKVVFQYDIRFPMTKITKKKDRKINISLEKIQRFARMQVDQLTTHRSFIEDVVKKLNEEPSVRIKKLVI